MRMQHWVSASVAVSLLRCICACRIGVSVEVATRLLRCICACRNGVSAEVDTNLLRCMYVADGNKLLRKLIMVGCHILFRVSCLLHTLAVIIRQHTPSISIAYRSIIIVLPQYSMVGVLPRHATCNFTYIVLSSARSCPSNIRPDRFSCRFSFLSYGIQVMTVGGLYRN